MRCESKKERPVLNEGEVVGDGPLREPGCDTSLAQGVFPNVPPDRSIVPDSIVPHHDQATAPSSCGLVHLYDGEGKGKTSAAMGLALRALGRGRHVVVLQFCKDGTSGEIAPLCKLGARVFAGSSDGRFASRLSHEERSVLRSRQNALLQEACSLDADMLVLDEACFATRVNLVDERLLKSVVLDRPTGQEIILTGRDPLPWMIDAADYRTTMRCVRHPYARGIPAREGIEF